MSVPHTILETPYPARYWHVTHDGRIQCDLCPRNCKLRNNQHGACFVRKRIGDRMILTAYGHSSGFCIDPIEKKPLNHFYPGSLVFSFGTTGCNLACKFCQNWDISKSRDLGGPADTASPAEIAQTAARHHCKSVAFTYNDPVIFAEYAMDTADECHAIGIQTVAVTNGYMLGQARRDFYSKIDAANIDLKAFTENFYAKLTGAHLQPVLDTLLYLRHETNVWVEITTLLIPGHNDSDEEINALCNWVYQELGADTALHFTAFHPDYRMNDVSPTPRGTLRRARAIGLKHGLNYVYTGNIDDADGTTTYCPGCRTKLITRNGYDILEYRITADGHCTNCDTAIAGRFAPGHTAVE